MQILSQGERSPSLPPFSSHGGQIHNLPPPRPPHQEAIKTPEWWQSLYLNFPEQAKGMERMVQVRGGWDGPGPNPASCATSCATSGDNGWQRAGKEVGHEDGSGRWGCKEKAERSEESCLGKGRQLAGRCRIQPVFLETA